MAKVLYDWQESDVQEWVEAVKSGRSPAVFNAWEQSLGKTLAAVEFAKRLDVNVTVIVLPLNTRGSWTRTFNEQWPDMPVRRITSKGEELKNLIRLTNGERGVYLIGWELMRGGTIEGQHADLVIADETHRQQNQRSNSHQAIKGVEGKVRMALSGTPAGNRPDGIFATLHWLWPKKYSSYTRWVDTFWRVRRNGAVIDLIREQNPGAIIADIPVFSRRKREDHRGDIPSSLPEVSIDVDMSPKQWKYYNKLVEEAAVWVDGEFIATPIALTNELRLGQLTLGVPMVDAEGEVTFALNCKSTKIDALIEVLKGQPEGATMLVFSPSARFIPAVVAQLEKKGYTARGLSGSLTPSNSPEREAALEEFGDKFQVLVASIPAIAEGTDGLQYKCSRQFWLDKHPNNMLNQQAKWRLDRPGQTEPVQSWYAYVPGTVNEKRIERLDEIEAALNEVIDNKQAPTL